jgi:hypothetical protein
MVHLLPIPSDAGCSLHYGNTKCTFSFNVDDDLTSVATSLNSKNPVQQELPAAEIPPPPQRRVPGQQEVFEVDWRELAVAIPSNQNHREFTLKNSERHGFWFKTAAPSADFTSSIKILTSQGGCAKQSFHGMSKSQKKKAKARAKKSSAAVSGACAGESSASIFLQPSDIARVRLFLCFHADVQNGQLPAINMEIDPQRPLADSIAEFEKKFEGCR